MAEDKEDSSRDDDRDGVPVGRATSRGDTIPGDGGHE